MTEQNLNLNSPSLAQINQNLKNNPNDAKSLAIKANILLNQRLFYQALLYFDKSLKIDPKNPDTLVNKGITLTYLKRFNEAIIAYNKALLLKPNSPIILINKANALDDVGDTNAAFEIYQNLISLNLESNSPIYISTWYNIGNSLVKQNKLTEAVEAYDKVLASEPNHLPSLTEKSIVLTKLGDFLSAYKVTENIIEIDPENIEMIMQKGDILYYIGEHKKAKDTFFSALNLEPYNVDILIRLGSLLSHDNKLSEALELTRRALKIEPTNIEVLDNMSSILNDMGDQAGAIKIQRKILSIAPQDKLAEHAIIDIGSNNESKKLGYLPIGNLKLDHTTFTQFYDLVPNSSILKHVINSISLGYEFTTSGGEFEGAKEITYIFDTQNRLTAVNMQLNAKSLNVLLKAYELTLPCLNYPYQNGLISITAINDGFNILFETLNFKQHTLNYDNNNLKATPN